MKFNPFLEKPKKIESTIMSLKSLSAKPYDKREVSPYTRIRCILMNGTEYEAVWSKHHFNRHYADNDARRSVALVRRLEQEQQKLIASLKPLDENILETTIGYEQLAVDLTATLAMRQTDKNIKNALDFALLEDFDHLYRYANLLETDMGEHAEHFVGSYTEIMPARPTVAHHRHPYDSVKTHIINKKADPITKCDIAIITAAEQQTMNYYMNIASFYKNQKGRELYTEIGMVEEDHVSHYGSLMDPNVNPLEDLLMHEYVECYLYYSMFNDEVDPNIKNIWEMLFNQELSHLHEAVKLLRKYDKKDWQEVIPGGEFPELLSFKPRKEYIREIIAKTVNNTADKESYINVDKLSPDADFFKYQNKFVKNAEKMPSHSVICNHIKEFGEDYRVQDKEHPIKALRSRTEDNINLGRTQN